jgi:BCD family chlorophyll transporter-like MFS transporter
LQNAVEQAVNRKAGQNANRQGNQQPPVAKGAGGAGKEGVRIGLWGGAQAIAFGVGGLLGAAASDVARALMESQSVAYASVFSIESGLFIASAYLASKVEK